MLITERDNDVVNNLANFLKRLISFVPRRNNKYYKYYFRSIMMDKYVFKFYKILSIKVHAILELYKQTFYLPDIFFSVYSKGTKNH